jgi:NADH:ubiquinone oxidoreductase subunit H
MLSPVVKKTMFPLDHCGEFRRSKSTIPDSQHFVSDFERRAVQALQACRGRNIAVQNGRVSFTAGIFRLVTNLNILNSVGYGHVEIGETANDFVVSYYISFRQMAVSIALVVIIFFGGFMFVNDSKGELPLLAKLAIIVGAWIFLFGVNWISGIIQVPSLVKSMLWGGDRIEQIVGPERRERVSHQA